MTTTTTRLLSFPELRPRGVPYSREHLRRLVKEEKFPAPVSLSPKRMAWHEADIEEWIAGLPRRSPKAAA
jgi:prophage regulatory protein